jgi:XRE family transcriptional regulator, fatty acid utilization regulator
MAVEAEELRLILGLKLRTLRQRRGFGLKELADRAGVSISYLSEIEKGRKYPKPAKLLELARALEIPFDELVSMRVGEELSELQEVVGSAYLREFPFHLFGLQAGDLLALGEPERAAALLRTFVDLGRMYGIEMDTFLLAALRSYQQMSGNSFPDLETAATEFRASLGLGARAVTRKALDRALRERFGYEIDYETLAKHPELGGFRSIFAAGRRPKLYVNSGLLQEQQAFLLAREIGHQVLGLHERPITSTWIAVESFAQLLDNFRASYFAGAVLIDRAWLVAKLRDLFGRPRWEPARFLKLLREARSTPEMFFHRLTEVVPAELGFHETYFLRFSITGEERRLRLTKVLNMTRIPLLLGLGLDEHFCRRWSAIRILQRLAEEPHAADDPIVSARRSHFFEHDQEFFVLSMARPLALDPTSFSSSTVGFRLDERFRETVRFWDDPALASEDIHTTCERCPLLADQCRERAAPPTHLQRREAQQRRVAAVTRFLEAHR